MGWLPGEPLMSADNLDSMRAPNVLHGDMPGLEALGIRPASIEAVMTALLAGQAGVARLEPLRARAHRS
jgi:NADH dehydrogenase